MTVTCDRILFLQWIACHANSSELAFYISKRSAAGFPHLPDFSSNPPSTPAPPDIHPVPLRDLQCQTHSPKGRMLRFVPHVKNSVSDLQLLSSERRTKIKCSIYLVKNERRTEKSENLMLLFEINVFWNFLFWCDMRHFVWSTRLWQVPTWEPLFSGETYGEKRAEMEPFRNRFLSTFPGTGFTAIFGGLPPYLEGSWKSTG